MTVRVPSQAARETARQIIGDLLIQDATSSDHDMVADVIAAFEADLIDRLVLTSNEVKAGKIGQEPAPEDVERVARAICCHRDGVPGFCAAKHDGSPFSVCQAHTYRGDARAAITAMGQPS